MRSVRMSIRDLHPEFWRGLFKESLLKNVSGISAEEYIVGEHSPRVGNIGAANVTARQAQRTAVGRKEICEWFQDPSPKPFWDRLIDSKTPVRGIAFIARK